MLDILTLVDLQFDVAATLEVSASAKFKSVSFRHLQEAGKVTADSNVVFLWTMLAFSILLELYEFFTISLNEGPMGYNARDTI